MSGKTSRTETSHTTAHTCDATIRLAALEERMTRRIDSLCLLFAGGLLAVAVLMFWTL